MSDSDGTVFVDPEDVRERLNIVEKITSDIGADNDFLSAMLLNQVAIGQQLQNLSVPNQPSGGREFDITNLAIGTVGIALEDINEGRSGDVLFRPAGSEIIQRVEANTDINYRETVKVTGANNKVSTVTNGEGIVEGSLMSDTFVHKEDVYALPDVVERGKVIKVGNQTYDTGNYSDNDSTINANSTETIAEINVNRNEFLLFSHTAATADPDLEYDYYINDNLDDSLSGISPWAEPPNLHEVVPDGYMLVTDSVRLEIQNTSGSNITNVEGDLLGILVSRKKG